MIAAVVLAAGEGSRYGGVKQLHGVGGRPMLERVLETLAGTAVCDRVVVLGAHADRVLAEVALHGARPVICRDWQQGQAASLAAGLMALPQETTGALVVLGDGPSLDPRACARLIEAARDPDDVLAADYGSGRSHPVLLPRTRWAELPVRGESPGRRLTARLVDCSDLRAPGDVDYAEA